MSLGDWENVEARVDLVAKFKEDLSGYRKNNLAKRQREAFLKGDAIFGVNWIGIDLFLKLTGLKSCKKPMGWVITNVVQPICEAEQCQLLELFLGTTDKSENCVGPVNWFHSYTWAEPFHETVASLGTNLFKPESTSKNFFWW